MLTALPVAMLAVPVIVGGRVTGVLVIVRDDATPFSDAEHDAVLRLAPMVGSALDAAARHDGVTEMTMVDGLTGLANRRRLDRDLPEALAWADATEGSVGFVMIDVDHFKTFNDTHGHAEGDRVLRTVGDLIRLNVREGDVVYRYGGEEFSVLLRDTTRDEVLSVAERIRAAVAGAGIEGGETQPAGAVTVSVGLALVDGGDPEACMTAADGALYDAKHAGRDRVAFAG
jgi:diguanylate cyclase (GGDEF)-like protein